MLNRFIGMGRLVRDPELRYTGNQTPVATFTVAIDDDYKDADGKRATQFVDCVAWRGTGEFVSKYFQKGSMAVVCGPLKFRDWTDKNGVKRRNAEIIVSDIYFGDYGRKDSEKNEEPEDREFTELEDDGDLPF